MKKILFLLLFSIFAFGQNVELLKKANKCDLDFAKQFADSIVLNGKTKYEYLDGAEISRSTNYNFLYVLPETTKEERAKLSAYLHNYYTNSSFECDKCLSVTFKIIREGGNSALEIPATKSYQFRTVRSKFLNLFPFWKQNVDKNASTNNTYENRPVYTYKNQDQRIWYNFLEENNYWVLVNMSDRFDQIK